MMFKLLNNHQIIQEMTRRFKLINLILFFIIISISNINASEFFEIGKKNFKEKKFEQSRLNFEKDIVRNTKNIKSYLFLAKIHKAKNNKSEFEKNLNTVLLLDPKNEEALYLLIKKKIEDADYDFAFSKMQILKKICKKLCNKINDLNNLKKKLKS